jgi:hypothetical protein
LNINIPAAYFYALAFDLSTNIDKDRPLPHGHRLGSASKPGPAYPAVNSNWIDLPATVNPVQACAGSKA